MAEQIGSNISDLITAVKNGVVHLGSLAKSIAASFPQITGTATSATAGAATLPANPVGFITIVLPDGSTGKVPYYAS